ncbi:MAG TPA: dockerin type I repeat-containing protein, partial [Clostridia bacterium]
INSIEVNQDENSITITAENYDIIEWIADSRVIATGNKIDLNDYEDKVKNYVRAQVKGPKGSSYTQPFGIKKSVIRIGDINKDGIVNSKDYALLKRHILGIDGYILKGESMLAADVDDNGTLTSKDLAYIKRYILNIINIFPVEKT